ncbi:hypothetical protein [Clostridium perfringens]|uniref:hypothetical protein n=1 Tax=Clostridium perfringens TaxID=1502 RepID=UPI000D7167CA|nr:hypothetical protein [Clostridium perfringens]PWW95981.1 hypothetical protein CYK84_06745 [Clostridium perfringens]
MKIVIENLDINRIKVSINYGGKEYSEVWEEKVPGLMARDANGIANQMLKDNVIYDQDDIEDIIGRIYLSKMLLFTL